MKILLLITMFLSSLFGWVANITALKGSANITRNNQIIPAKVGTKLDKSDIIKTQKNTKMQIIFKDNTVITIGKNSEVKIANYLFDGKNSTAKFNLSHGIMKTLTGKIGKFAPRRFKVITKNASIGIRGTYFVVQSNDDYVKLGMITGVTVFTNLDDMKTYEVTAGEELTFTNKQINIKKGFVEPDAVKFLKKEKKATEAVEFTTRKVSTLVNDVKNEANEIAKNVTQNQNQKSSGTFSKFIEGLKDLF